MKTKIFYVLALVVTVVSFVSCATLGVATKGAEYFNGKKEEDLVKYFKYDGDPVKTSDEYDKVLHFTNHVITIYVEKTTVEKFKNSQWLVVRNFFFQELYDGCLIPTDRAISDAHAIHKYFNNEINAKINDFNSIIKQNDSVSYIDADKKFQMADIGSTYYVYDIQASPCTITDDYVSGGKCMAYHYNLKKISVFEDSRSVKETHTAYIFEDRTKSYKDENGNQLSKEQASENEKSYVNKGFTSRRKDKGLSMTAYIKDGIVVKVEQK